MRYGRHKGCELFVPFDGSTQDRAGHEGTTWIYEQVAPATWTPDCYKFGVNRKWHEYPFAVDPNHNVAFYPLIQCLYSNQYSFFLRIKKPIAETGTATIFHCEYALACSIINGKIDFMRSNAPIDFVGYVDPLNIPESSGYTTARITSATTVLTGEPVSIGLTVDLDNSTWTIYIQGKPEMSYSRRDNPSVGALGPVDRWSKLPHRIGFFNPWGAYFYPAANTALGDLQIYNRCLTPGEVKRLHMGRHLNYGV